MRKYLLSVLLIVVSSGALAAGTTCPTQPMAEGELNPIALRDFVNNNKVQSISAFVCCLPPSFRKNYIIAPASHAAQSGNPCSPRILMFNELRKPETKGGGSYDNPLNMVISINGGNVPGCPNVNQANSVEIMFDDKTGSFNKEKKPQVAYFDFEFPEKADPTAKEFAHLSGANPPDKCMMCHGTQGEAGPGGPRPIFEPVDNWGALLNGSNCVSDKMQESLRKAVAGNMKTNSRYDCLDPDPKGTDPFKLKKGPMLVSATALMDDLDVALADLDSRRIAEEIRGSPDYDKFKYVILASAACPELSSANASWSKLDLGEWIPPNTLKTLDNKSFLKQLFRTAPTSDLQNILITDRRKAYEAGENLKAQHDIDAAKLDAGDKKTELKTTTLPTCRDRSEVLEQSMGDPKRTEMKPDLLKRYVFDTESNGQSSRNPGNGVLRFLFEGRGINTGQWTMTPTVDPRVRGPANLAYWLLENDRDPKLAQLKSDWKARGLLRRPSDKITPEQFETFRQDPNFVAKSCESLRQISMKSFDPSIEVVPKAIKPIDQ